MSKLLELHEKAMNYSFIAKQARELGKEDDALKNYALAAEIESQVAEFYLDKPELEPTRSIIIRSAAFLNLKAGLTEQSEKFIFHGLININDETIKQQLYDALELCMAYKDFSKSQISQNIDYIYQLRQKSVLYTLEPKIREYSSAVTLDMITDFSVNYTKSIKAYGKSKYKDYFAGEYQDLLAEEAAAEAFHKSIKPIVTNAAFGSFKFSLATDIVNKIGESKELFRLKTNILINYHREIFTPTLSDENIKNYKQNYSTEEIEAIFRPVFNIKTNKAVYKVGYYNKETFKKQYLSSTSNSDKLKLLPTRTISDDDIGTLENIIAHRRNSEGGSTRSIIIREQMKSATFDYPTEYVEAKGEPKIILNEKILLNVEFNSETGFVVNFDELGIEVTATKFDESLNKFYIRFVEIIRELKSQETLSEMQTAFWNSIKRLITNPNAIN